jgi:hypothetical protein
MTKLDRIFLTDWIPMTNIKLNDNFFRLDFDIILEF